MYTLANGKRVKELQIELEKEGCKITQAYWLNGRLVRDCFNEETDEYTTIDEYETPKDQRHSGEGEKPSPPVHLLIKKRKEKEIKP